MKKLLIVLVILTMIATCSAVNSPPAIPSIPSGPTSGASGTSYGYSTKAIDPDGNSIKFTFDWCDGTTSTSPTVASGSTIKMFHKWASGGTKAVRTKATDTLGVVSGWSGTLSVVISGPTPPVPPEPPIPPVINNPPAKPSIPWGALTGYTKYPYTYSTKATDPDGDQVKYTFAWGDGTTTTTGYVASGALAYATHQWKGETGGAQGFDITTKATDEHGKESVQSQVLPITMVTDSVNYPPTIPVVSGPTSGISGTSYTFSIVSTDPDGDKIKCYIHWGTSGMTTGYFLSGQVATVSHTWAVPAGATRQYNVVAMATDSNEMTNTNWSEPLVITITGPTKAMLEEAEIDSTGEQNSS